MKYSTKITTKSGITHALARCEVCGWENESYKHAHTLAETHSRRTGHKVRVEQGLVTEYVPEGTFDQMYERNHI